MSVVDSTFERGILKLSIAGPRARNTLDPIKVGETRKALASVKQDPELRLVILASGVERVFSLGMNLEILDAKRDTRVWESFAGISEYAELLVDLATYPVPTVAVVDGIAAGGGVELACICDTVIGTDNASFTIAQLRKGLFPFITAAVLVPRISHARFLQWALSGQSFPAKRLHDLGLINQLCAPDALERTLSVYTDRLLGFDAATLRAGIAFLRTEAEAALVPRIRHAQSLFTLNCLERKRTESA